MIDYQEIWESVNAESVSSGRQRLVARRVRTSGAFPIFLASDYKSGLRLLYLKADSLQQLDLNELPGIKGLEVCRQITTIGGFSDKEFIKFSQVIPASDRIFEYFISDLCDAVAVLKDASSLFRELHKILSAWKIFFEGREKPVLSLSAQKGLVGELVFLKEHLLYLFTHQEAISFWTGADKTTHDFQLGENAVEVKATSSKQHKKFTVSSERQLDEVGLKHLYLAIFTLRLHQNLPARSLPVLVQEIQDILQEDPVAFFHFNLKVTKYGYSMEHAAHYKTGFTVADAKMYEVKEGLDRKSVV